MFSDFVWHRITSKTRHGVHSPFVYSLVEDCIYGNTHRGIAAIERYFKNLRNSAEEVSGIDHGRGGALSTHTVGELAGRSAIRDFQARLLHRLVLHHRPQHILELGTNIGKSAACMAAADPAAHITTVEGNEGLCTLAKKHFRELGLDNVACVHAEFSGYLATLGTGQFDMVFIDGNHRYGPTMEYFHLLKPRLRPGGAMVFHDIYWSEGMKGAWREIKKDPATVVALDLFFFGIVYFGRDQAREDFRIRFPRSLVELFR